MQLLYIILLIYVLIYILISNEPHVLFRQIKNLIIFVKTQTEISKNFEY